MCLYIYIYISLNIHSLKDNNPEVYKIFSEGNLDIRWAMIENGQDWHSIYWGPLKVKGQKRGAGLKKLREAYDISPCLLTQLLTGTKMFTLE